MNVFDLINERRTIRIYKEDEVPRTLLVDMVECARVAPSAANLQPLKYVIIDKKEVRDALYPHIHYAGYLPDFDPTPDECPRAFVAVLCDEDIRKSDRCECDAGLAMMSMCLLAKERGYDTVILGAIARESIAKILHLAPHLSLMYLVGVGVGAQSGSTFPLSDGVKYRFDEKRNVEVPKRALSEILIEEENKY